MNMHIPAVGLKASIAALVVVIALLHAGCAAGPSPTGRAADAAQPDLSAKKTFVATPPYTVLVKGTPQAVPLWGKPRTYDFVGNSFVNPKIKAADADVMTAWDPAGSMRPGNKITNEGMPGHIENKSGRLMVGSLAGDFPAVGKTCRAQVASYAVPSRQKVYWDYIVQLGSTEPGREWVITKPRASPVLISQLKALDAVNPSLAIIADSDPLNSSRLQLGFSWKGGHASKAINVGKAHNIAPNTPVRIVMEAFLDERETSEGGKGYWRAWVDGALVVNLDAPTLYADASTPHQWLIDTYMYNDPCPNNLNRFTYWDRAKMLTD